MLRKFMKRLRKVLRIWYRRLVKRWKRLGRRFRMFLRSKFVEGVVVGCVFVVIEMLFCVLCWGGILFCGVCECLC